MKTKNFLSILALGVIVGAFGQNTIELTFTAIDVADYAQLDSIKVMNRTQGSDTVLYYPDTILILDYQVGISETNISTEGIQLFHNYPNPVIDQTTISFYIPERDRVGLIVSDMLGRALIKAERILDQGYHSYRFTPGNGSLFLFTLQWRQSSTSIKMLQHNSVSKKINVLEYIGSMDASPQLKSSVDIQNFLFNLGDELLFIGYTDSLQSGMLHIPEESQAFTLQFATNIPCPEIPTVEYHGQIYNTIQIFSQCWLKENLNVGTMVSGNQNQQNNDTIEKYCYDNDTINCNNYGGLYQWGELMRYSTIMGTQGICPLGWHLPTDEEWKVLEGAVDGYYAIGDPKWDSITWRGFDAGLNIKSASGWNWNGNGTNQFNFTGLPGGYRSWDSEFYNLYFEGDFWSSTEHSNNDAWRRELRYNHYEMNRNNRFKHYGFSCRCLKD